MKKPKKEIAVRPPEPEYVFYKVWQKLSPEERKKYNCALDIVLR